LNSLLIALELKKPKELKGLMYAEEEKIFNSYGFYVGHYTLEVDIMNACTKEESRLIMSEVFNELTDGEAKQKANFKQELYNGEFWKCLSKIENNGIGKGRFAQKFANRCKKDHIPKYIKDGIEDIIRKVTGG